jgi:hypothetical protein
MAAPTGIYMAGYDVKYTDLADDTQVTLWTPPYNISQYGRSQFVRAIGPYVYWSTYYGDSATGGLWRSGMNGANAQLLVPQADQVTRNIESYGGRVYWANEVAGAIYSANLDGSDVRTEISGYTGDGDGIVDFEIYNGRFYWTSWSSGYVSTTDLDGNDYRQFAPANSGRVFAIEIDSGKMYLADHTGATMGIASYDLDGTNRSTLVSGRYALGMDIFDGHIYYNDERASEDGILRVPLAGGLEEQVSQHYMWQFDVVPEPATAGVVVLALGMILCERRVG